mgnify:CR=1 FL=1
MVFSQSTEEEITDMMVANVCTDVPKEEKRRVIFIVGGVGIT